MNTTVQPLAEMPDLIRQQWHDLATSIGANYSLFPDWIRITAISHNILEQSEVALAFQGDDLSIVLPVYVTTTKTFGVPTRTLELVANRASYHNCPISSLPPDVTFQFILEAAMERKADVLHLAAIPDDSELGDYLANHSPPEACEVHTLPREVSPYLPITMQWQELLASKSGNFRYRMRKRNKALEPSGQLQIRWYRQPEDCAALLDAMQAVEDNSWKKDAGISIFDRDHERRYYENLLPFLSSRQSMLANAIFKDEKPIAYNLCCIWDGWVGQLKTSFDLRHATLSPGLLGMDHVVEHAFELGAKEFDFLGDTDRHKLAWSEAVRSHTDYFLYLKTGFKGRLLGRMKKLRKFHRDLKSRYLAI